MRIDRRRACAYGAVPALLGAGLVAAYFSGLSVLEEIAAPARQREFGLVENLQNLLLIGMAVIAARAARREPSARMRFAWWAVGLAAVFVLMEEVDWGDHYVAALTGRRLRPGEHFNLHNQGNVTGWTKRVVDTGLALGFVLAPMLSERLPVRARPWLPSPYSFLTVVVALLSSRAGHWLEDAGFPNNGSLRSNISEFREVFVYWLAWLYLAEIAIRRTGLAFRLLVPGQQEAAGEARARAPQPRPPQ